MLSKYASTLFNNIFLITLLLSLCGCGIIRPTEIIPSATLDETAIDRSLLTDEPCRAPCWYGLVIGQSTKEEVIETINNLSFINHSSIVFDNKSSYMDPITHKQLPTLRIYANYYHLGNDVAYFEILDNILVKISISPTYSISFLEVVKHLGSPDYIVAIPDTRSKVCKVNLIWAIKNINIWRYLENGISICDSINQGDKINPHNIIDYINYEVTDSRIPREGSDLPWPGFFEGG
jgi:hypothetical protein